MFIRRFSQALRDADWTIVLLDFLVVVIGILVGLQIDDWNRQRHDRLESYEALAQIDEELASQQAAYERNRQGGEQFRAYVGYLDELIDDPALAREQPSRVLQAILLSTYHSSFRVPDAVYRQIEVSGKLTPLGNQALQSAIQSHYENVTTWDAVIERLYFKHNGLDRALTGMLDIEQLTALMGSESELFGDFVMPGFNASDAEAMARRLGEQPEVRKWLPGAWFYHNGVANISQDFLPAIEALRGLIATELETVGYATETRP